MFFEDMEQAVRSTGRNKSGIQLLIYETILLEKNSFQCRMIVSGMIGLQ